MSDGVLEREQAHLLRARAGLKRMREHTRALLDGEAQWGNDPLTSRALAAALAAAVITLALIPFTPAGVPIVAASLAALAGLWR